jgi:chemotaxis signal transduction protein
VSNVITAPEPFVLFPLGTKRFALPAEQVSELARQDKLQTFPHTTPLITGVVLRRHQVVPVVEVAHVLVGAHAPERKFFLVVQITNGRKKKQMAIPVSGECELAEAEQLAVTGDLPQYVAGLLSLQNEIVEILDLEKVLSTEVLE